MLAGSAGAATAALGGRRPPRGGSDPTTISLAADRAKDYFIGVDPLRILVIDVHAHVALPLIDLLSRRGHRCELKGAGLPALAAIAAQREAGRPYQAVVANAAFIDIDPVGFVRILRERKERMPVVYYAPSGQLDRSIFEAASALDAHFLDLPVDAARLMPLVEREIPATATIARRQSADGEPFFGTGRITRPTPTGERYQQRAPNTALPSSEPGSGGPPPLIVGADGESDPLIEDGGEATRAWRGPVTDNQHPVLPPVEPIPFDPASVTRQRTPLPATGNPAHQGTDRYANPGNVTTTARIRRGVTGRIQKPPQPAPAVASGEWRVACATCRREFMVEARPRPYNIVCLHCGQLNRIEPRPT
jgi:hypothetical protein